MPTPGAARSVWGVPKLENPASLSLLSVAATEMTASWVYAAGKAGLEVASLPAAATNRPPLFCRRVMASDSAWLKPPPPLVLVQEEMEWE